MAHVLSKSRHRSTMLRVVSTAEHLCQVGGEVVVGKAYDRTSGRER